jgi:hypothetical protein
VRASSLEAIFIFVCPPSFEELEKRLRARGTETEEQIQKRLRNARAELDQSNSPGLFDHLLVNDDLETCYENLKQLLSLDDDQEDSDDLCKFHELCCLQFPLMLRCVFSYSKFRYCQLSRMVNKPQVTVLCLNMTQKFCCNLSLMKPKMELQACMLSCPCFFLIQFHAMS